MAVVLSLTASALDDFVGKTIEDICPLHFGKIGDEHNHCAHFVSHVLKLNPTLQLGATCGDMLWHKKDSPAAACMRVNDVYNACNDLAKADETGCLAYYTLPGNIDKDGRMGQMSQKHIGIYFQGSVWNYGNKKDAVRKDAVDDLGALYGTKTITRFTEFPLGATLLTLAQIQALASTP